ncbi:MAG: outer membrane beta-barrel protein [Bacteroidales bacterium]|nr:outer membrane beta-barrel protein [Bacteroidales bacterium]
MKKIFFMVLALTMIVGVSNAQIVRSNSVKVTKEEGESMWYARLGLNMMKAAGDDVEDCNTNIGYQIVWGFEKPLGPCFWGMEFGLGSRGYKVDGDYSNKMMVHNVVFTPFNIGYKHSFSDEFAVEAHVGPYVAADYFGVLKNVPYYEGKKVETEDVNIYDLEDYVFPDAGVSFGFGVWYNSIGIDLCLQKGMINWNKDVKMHTSNFLIRLGFKF